MDGSSSAPTDVLANRELEEARRKIAELSRSQKDLSRTLGRLTEMATTDPLTGLANRRRFEQALDAAYAMAIRQNWPISLVMFDVDHFKAYNDEFGHTAGDAALATIGRLLITTLRGYDIPVRYGGEEFATLLPATDAEQAMNCAERLRAVMASYTWPFRAITASFGVATVQPSTLNAETLISEADQALYRSKREGRNRVTHYRSIAALRPLSEVHSPSWGLPGGELPGPMSSPDAMSPWNALDRFVTELLDGKHAPNGYREVISAVREATGAHAAVVFSGQTGIALSTDADPPFALPDRDFLMRLHGEFPQGGIWANPDAEAGRVLNTPSFAAVIPLPTPQSKCLVVLKFSPAAAFSPSDLVAIRVIWRIQTGCSRFARAQEDLKETLFGVIRCLSTAIDAKDPYTCGHSERVARIAVRLGEQQGLPRGEISDLYLAGLLHDVGKIGIRDDILLKEGPLTPNEIEQMRQHTIIGDRIVANVARLSYLRPGVRGHHERFDGKGYPDGLSGKQIPRIARILAVADTCDAMMSNRRYRTALSADRIECIFREGAGSQWDPEVVDHFFASRSELYAVCQRGLGQTLFQAVEHAAGQDCMRSQFGEQPPSPFHCPAPKNEQISGLP